MPIYMDHNATTPLDPRVRAAMLPYLGELFGNASSVSHAFGWQAQTAVKKAREQVAGLLGCRAADVLWTSGATESNNLAILGVVRAYCKQKPHIITQATEHKAVLEVCEAAQDWGAEITVLGVDGEGRVRVEELEPAIRPNTVMVSVMMANNEVGTIQPTAEIAKICAKHRLIFHADAAQSAGKYAFSLQDLPVDLLSISGHKLYGPKGVGALIVRTMNRDFELKPILFGGDQEKKLRPGTLNVPGIVGLGEACAVARETLACECDHLRQLQNRLLGEVLGRFPQVRLNGPREDRLCNNLSFSFPDLHADDMAIHLGGIAYSSGSACNSASPKPSHVLKAMGLPDDQARATLRLGLGRFTTAEEVELVLGKLLKMLERTYR
jgi:cysteine desulfurase